MCSPPTGLLHHNLADSHQFGQQRLKIFQLEHIGALIRKAVQASLDANYVTEDIDKNNAHKVCNFLYELAQEFSRFYENCPVAGDAREAERAQIIRAYLNVMEHGLNILGIQIPEEM